MGGTNAHVIVEQAPAGTPTEEAARDSKDRRAQPHQAMTTVWVLSGRSDQALADQSARLRDHVADHAELDVNDVGWSLATTRTPFEHRAVLVGADRRQFRKGLTGLASRRPGAGTVVGRVRPMGKTAFVFPGQGAQWPGMGAGLYERFPVFARAFDQAARALNEHLRVPLGEVMWGNAADAMDGTEFAQPALFALEAALATLLADWGVVPDVVLGHSVGEITAAHVAGVLSLADAAKLVAARGRLMAGLPAGGAMVAVAAAEAEVVPMLTDGVSIAALNGPNAVVISGAESAVGAIAETFRQRGRRVHRLAVSHAFHSPLMEPMIEDFAAVAATVSVAEPRITLVDNISGRPAGPGYGSAQHWVDHVRAPVRFVDGVRAAESAGAGVFVEVGPGGGLSAAMEQSLTAQGSLAVVTMPKGQPEADSLLTAAGRLFADGGQVDWGAALARGRRVRLPTYAFVRQRYWLDTAAHPVTQPAPEPADLAEHLRRADPD
jgi:acyl transferase domain-containing protein